ncbi:MAG: shikimate kinase, partial [Kiritimatiellota bacterium]|nr:shikimate kinase [Kiritimatiellota bacterium]
MVGFMGTGKTTIGRALADQLQRDFVDMDIELEARAGKPIPRIFAEDGEPVFRRMERDLVIELSRQSNLVIAAGGGIVLNPDNIRDFSATGQIICLKATPDEIIRRVSGSNHRPLLEQGDKGERIRKLLMARQPFYDAFGAQVDTTGKTFNELVSCVLGKIPNSKSHIPSKQENTKKEK